MRCQWLGGRSLDKWTRDSVKLSHSILTSNWEDFGQLPPVMDLTLYTTAPQTPLAVLGSSAYQLFDHAVVLNQVMQQSGEDPSQVLFRQVLLLLQLRDGQVTKDEWRHFMSRTPAQVSDLSPFTAALHLFPTTEAVMLLANPLLQSRLYIQDQM